MAARPRTIGLLGLLLLLAPAVAWRLLVWIETPSFHPVPVAAGPGALNPDLAIVAARDTRIVDVAFSPDGGRLFVYLQIGAVNVWSLLTEHWPELTLVVLALLGLLLSCRLRRRRPTTTDPHCRRCDYRLSHRAGDHCPECGLELVPPNLVRARPPRWRVLLPLLVVLALVLVHGLIRVEFPRSITARKWFVWPSAALFDFAYHRGGLHQLKATNHKVYVDRILELDAATGRVLRTVFHEKETLQLWAALVASPDGRWLAALNGQRVALLDARSGTEQRRFQLPDPVTAQGADTWCAAAFSADGEHLYAATWTGRIFQWSIGSGELLRTVEIDDLVTDAEGERSFIRRIIPAPETAQLMLVVVRYATRYGSMRQDLVAAALVLVTNESLEPVRPPDRVQAGDFYHAAGAPDGSRFYILEAAGDLIVGDRGRGFRADRRALPGRRSLGLEVSPDGRWLFVGRSDAARENLGHLYAAEDLTPIIGLGDSTLVGYSATFARDGSRVAVNAREMSSGHGGSTLALYDLSSVRDE